jgi:hypothetical protein
MKYICDPVSQHNLDAPDDLSRLISAFNCAIIMAQDGKSGH